MDLQLREAPGALSRSLQLCQSPLSFWALTSGQQVPLLVVVPKLWKGLVYKALCQKCAAHVSEKPGMIPHICSALSVETQTTSG